MRTLLIAIAALATAGAAAAQHPDPNRPYTVVSGYDPRTGGYASTESFTDYATGLPVQRGYGFAPLPAWPPPPPAYPPAVWYAPAPAYYYPPPPWAVRWARRGW